MLEQDAYESGRPAPQLAVPVYRDVGVQASERAYVAAVPELEAAYAVLRAAKATFDAACLHHFANVATAPVAEPEAVSPVIEQLASGWHKKTTFRKGGRRDCVYVLPAGEQGGDDLVVGSVAAMAKAMH
jgi:hypothetical protein